MRDARVSGSVNVEREDTSLWRPAGVGDAAAERKKEGEAVEMEVEEDGVKGVMVRERGVGAKSSARPSVYCPLLIADWRASVETAAVGDETGLGRDEVVGSSLIFCGVCGDGGMAGGVGNWAGLEATLSSIAILSSSQR